MKEKLKIHILFEFKEGPWGGGNQFLKALRNYFINNGVYTEDIEEADIVFFNSNQPSLKNINYMRQLFKLNYKSNTVIINRIDGPIRITRKGFDIFDDIILIINKLFMNACIFQSNWSMNKMKEIGDFDNLKSKLILNIPDDNIFYPKSKSNIKRKKMKIIATSWSSKYYEKGFHILEYLDNNLDFNKYEMTFVGNTSVHFKNIRYVNPLPSKELAEEIRKHDIFFTASINDACSNSLLEGLQCGLPAVYINSGGNPEIVGKAGVSFEDQDDVLQAIDRLSNNYEKYRLNIKYRKTKDVMKMYYDFGYEVYKNTISINNISGHKKRVDYLSYFFLLYLLFKINLKNYVKNYKNIFIHIIKR